MNKFSLSDLKQMGSDERFGNLRSLFESTPDQISCNLIIRFCAAFMEDTSVCFEDTMKPYLVARVSRFSSDRLNRDTWLSYEEDVPYCELGDIINLFKLRYLDMSGVNDKNDIEGFFLDNSWAKSFEYIALSYTFMGDDIFRNMFEAIDVWTDLEGFDLTACNLDDESLLYLERAISEGKFPKLAYVEAADNTFGDFSLDLMYRSEYLQRLKVLDVTGSMELTEENLIHYASGGASLFQSSAYRKYNYSDEE